jgi:hypothetical protein
MARVFDAFFLAAGAEGLARAGACPGFAVLGPAGEFEGERPATNPAEEMALLVPGEIAGRDFTDVALINLSAGKVAGCNQVP